MSKKWTQQQVDQLWVIIDELNATRDKLAELDNDYRKRRKVLELEEATAIGKLAMWKGMVQA